MPVSIGGALGIGPVDHTRSVDDNVEPAELGEGRGDEMFGLDRVGDVTDRRARFRCVLVFLEEGRWVAGEGVFEGEIAEAQKEEALLRAVDLAPKMIEHLEKRVAEEGLERVEVSEASAGDIVCVSGIEGLGISDTLCAPECVEALPALAVDEPTISMMSLAARPTKAFSELVEVGCSSCRNSASIARRWWSPSVAA